MQIKVREQFGCLLNQLNLHGWGIEVGVADGNFSEVIIRTSNLSKIFLLDSWRHYDDGYIDSNNKEDTYQELRYLNVLRKMHKYGERVRVIRADCKNAVQLFSDNLFDFVYLDANHSYSFVKETLKDWYPKVKIGGVFAGHDYLNGIMADGTNFGVKKAVDEFVKKINVQLYHTTDDTPYMGNTNILISNDKRYFSWYVVKPDIYPLS